MDLVVILVISLVVTMPWVQSLETKPGRDPGYQLSWAKRLNSEKEAETNLEFYFHDKLSGKKPSAVRVAQASDTNSSSTLFGAVLIADDPLTESPDPSSKLVGRAQGLYGSAGQQDLSLIMAMNYGFVDGPYNGSSLSILGLNSAMHPVREMAIVGGTGVFRMAQGYAVAKTYSLDPATGDAIVGYNVTVITRMLSSSGSDRVCSNFFSLFIFLFSIVCVGQIC